jgi:hypothetical protein
MHVAYAVCRSADGRVVSKEAAQLGYGSLLSWAELKRCN